MKLDTDPRLPREQDRLLIRLYDLFRAITTAFNSLAEGRIQSVTAFASVPTAGAWNVGDEVRNSNPSELGTAGSKYVIRGWICVAAGSPGTWKEQRTLTGA